MSLKHLEKTTINIEEFKKVLKDIVANHQPFTMKVTGTSMRPFLLDKQTTVTLHPPHQLQKYDIILYEDQKNTLRLHRIIKLDNPLLVCGDALTVNEHIPQHNVLAKLTQYTHKHKTINPTDKTYLVKVKLWQILKPFRKIIIKLFIKNPNKEDV